ncbi:MAG TPA: penicillin-binding transpeptidase domain-containing protein [Acetivibrio sp.]|nr:peptidoglycan glycosyltransferase [Clostridium sp.]HOQ36467.1 penicillin-binding transpeptidase domain-containing protein [Acetivibrio sp.]HPT90518.1 penicillin-binding transpeptidase domain-containing protein [Acetivibrio sp.]HQA57106.1 penicillin-binding transpeptidase domain-containing protein [Acetivibrio sp.]
MNYGRQKFILYVFTLIIFLLITRFIYIQFHMGEKLTLQAAAQKISSLPIDVPRGNILDRNLIPLTNRIEKYDVVIKPFQLRNNPDAIRRISDILDLNHNDIKRQIEIKSNPIVIETDKDKKNRLKEENIPGISFINSLKRYDFATPAKHVLGYLNKIDLTGETGIEKAYNEYLKSGSPGSIGMVTDGIDNLLPGLGYRFIKPKIKEQLNIKLTIDYNIQKIAEEVMNKYNLKGAVVIEEVFSGDIVAMVSKPDFDPNEVAKYLDSPDNELFNRAVASYNLGSIFKIIDLASAYSKNMDPSMYYYCPGYVTLGDKEFRCSAYARGGHGLINLHEAFASSCNPYFIELGIRVGPNAIIDTAKNFGLGNVTGIDAQGISESPGYLPDPSNYLTYGDTANIAIGQGDVMATPLQVADMVATIANGGIKNKVNIVDSIVDSKGNTVKVIRKNKGERIIEKTVCDSIKKLMEEVTISGTGTKANLDAYGGAGGKTGSAETGQYINGSKVVHAWFAGYFPRLDPKYSVCVFIENGKSGGSVAAPVFEEIAKNILIMGY